MWAVADVEANCLVVYAYQYTSITSVMLLDCFTIPCAMLISRILLGAMYTRIHVSACIISLCGLLLTVFSDLHAGKSGPSPSGPAWLGDLYVLIGASLYGFSNVMQESILKGRHCRCEALGMLGLLGTLISVVQAYATERSALSAFEWSAAMVLPLVGFQLCLFGMYTLTSIFLLRSDAALFNLSLLTSDVYSVVYSWRVQHQTITWCYGAAFATTLSGLVLYHCDAPAVPVCSDVALASEC